MENIIRILIGFLIKVTLLIFFSSCAIVRAPEGGKKDIFPPKVIKEIPSNYSINFNRKKIEIVFDEFIQVKNVNKDVIISPLMKKRPEFNIKNNRIIINLIDTLEKGTTYNFNFSGCIVDLNEGNALKKYSYIFSTGSWCDSARISGRVVDAFSQDIIQDVKILLYLAECDSCLYKQTPNYYSIIDSDGMFAFSNLKPQKYQIYAVQDLNGNNRYDNGEKIGFLDSIINLKVLNDSIYFNIYNVRDYNCNLINYKVIDKNKIKFIFKNSFQNLKVFQVIGLQNKQLYCSINENADTVICWFYPPVNDSLLMNIIYSNKDTSFKIITSKSEKKTQKDKLKIYAINDLYRSQKIFLLFSDPVFKIIDKDIWIFEDSIKKQCKWKGFFSDSTRTKLALDYNFKSGLSYSFVFPDSIFYSIYGTTNDTFIVNLNTKKESELGTIGVKIICPKLKSNIIIELINRNKEVVRRDFAINGSTIQFGSLIPDLYMLRAILDDNNNGIWDIGSLEERRQPESIFYYPEQILLKPNWEINDLNFYIPLEK